MIFDDFIKAIRDNKNNADNGDYNVIPFLGLNRLQAAVPGIEKGCMYIVTASSGVGKSKLTRQLFITSPYEYCQNNDKVSVKIFLFSLEESLHKVLGTELMKWLKINYDITVDYRTLFSRGRNNILPDEVLARIESVDARMYIENFTNTIEIVTDIKNPYGMYKHVKDYLHENGKIVKSEKYKQSTYVPNDPNHYVIVIADHISLMTTENSNSLHKTIGDWSSNYCLELKNKYGCSIVNVQQQASQQESVDNRNANMLEPTASGLGDNKLTQRDAEIIMTLYDPWRHLEGSHGGYNINILRNKYRSLGVVKNRDGIDARIGLLFNGALGTLAELPPASNREALNHIYSNIN